MYKILIKRLLDVILSLISIIITLPLQLIILIILSLSNNFKPFFIQYRPGREAKLFRVLKFKTMNDRKNPDGKLLPDSERITRIGRIIRKTSLDELPQLFNVLVGDMSLIGPRPLLVSYLSRYNDFQKKRHAVRPGITGWAQVNGRNLISWEEKFELDIWYVENLTFLVDLKILYLTILKVILREGVSSAENVTMEEFMGTTTPNVKP